MKINMLLFLLQNYLEKSYLSWGQPVNQEVTFCDPAEVACLKS